jgi:hypothetical protein
MGQAKKVDWYLYVHKISRCSTPFYIGIACLDNRIRSYRNRSAEWHEVVSRNKGFYSKVLRKNLSCDEARQLEKKCVLKLGRVDLGTGTLVNLNDGGQGHNPSIKTRRLIGSYHRGKVVSKETRVRLSLSHIGQKAWNKGVPATPEQAARLKQMRAMQGPVSPEGLKRIGDAARGRIKSKDELLKISLSKMGSKNPMWGKRKNTI